MNTLLVLTLIEQVCMTKLGFGGVVLGLGQG